MPLDALIIRADGVLAETDEIERLALNRVLDEAGFTQRCDRAQWRQLKLLGSRRALVTHFVERNLRTPRVTEDHGQLIEAMLRRMGSVRKELIGTEISEARAGVRELVSAARREGARLALVSALPEEETRPLIASALGLMGEQLFDAIVMQSASEPAPLAMIYHRALARLDLPAERCLAVEATAAGLAASRQAGLPTVVSRSLHAANDEGDAILFVTDLPALITHGETHGPYALKPGDGYEIFAALQRLHAGLLDFAGNLSRSAHMKVADILKSKGPAVKTIRATDTILELAQKLKTDNVGAMVVVGSSGSLDGIISERDIANGLAEHGAALAGMRVQDLMTRAVVTCSAEDSISNISKIMTQRRFRHIPVQQDGKLIGLISIGDVLKHRLDELQLEANVLRDFVIARS